MQVSKRPPTHFVTQARTPIPTTTAPSATPALTTSSTPGTTRLPALLLPPVDVDDAEDPDPEPEPEEPEGPELMRDAVAEYPMGAVADEVC